MDVEFVLSAPDLASRPPRVLPEFAFVGRSNCGKSSLINLFLDRRGMAKISGKPGKTRLLNYFLVDNTYYLVDLPGYGFAKVSKTLRAAWTRLMKAYLFAGDRPLAVIQLLDARHRPSAEDRLMTGWLHKAKLPFAVAVTKVDKVGRNKRGAHYQEIVDTLGLTPETPFFPTSAVTREGAGDLKAWIAAVLAT
ncbi:ribosome biogenesis GTP-binding protein YihA/YsxC [bacterium]|nr:ribosome biogenesis GTP-binding protein YihA/YsxC [bacterium]MBU1071863.1 ribosome biogenesis GTP-binding protein YihA/YsxC [bacterium]MBU1675447.1 ribosome biogenesis GTP-binding protein YihA/YsxC [bacterium]